MFPILTRYGPFFLYTYTALLGTAVAAAYFLAARDARFAPARTRGWPEALLAALFGGLIGGRLAYVATNWAYFADHPVEAALPWLGGLAYHGALIGGLAALAWAARDRFARYAALFAPGFALGHVLGWLACGFAGCAYGRPTTLDAPLAPLLAADLPDLYGVMALRFPTQWLAAALAALVFIAVYRHRPTRPAAGLPASRLWLALLGTTAVRLTIAPLRGDPLPTLGPLRLDLLVDAAILLLAAIAYLRARQR